MPTKHIKISTARPRDVFGIQEVFYASWSDANPAVHGHRTLTEYVDFYCQKSRLEKERALARMPRNEFMLVARDRDMVVGFLHGLITPHVNRLLDFFVMPNYQRRGIGTKLWHAAMHRFDMTKEILVEVGVSNKKAIEYYRELGFKDIGMPGSVEGRSELKDEHAYKFPEIQLVFDWHPHQQDK